MRRLLPAIALLACLAVPAQAKVLIVAAEWKVTAANGTDQGQMAGMAQRVANLERILDTFGASYKVLRVDQMKTEWARTGVVTYDFGTGSARTESFDAVIHAGFMLRGASSRNPAYRPESLTTVTKLPLVPQLMLLSEDNAAGQGTLTITSTSCSTGVAAGGWEQAGTGSGSHDEEGVYYSPRTNAAYNGSSVLGHWIMSYAAANTAKGLQVLLAQGTGGIGGFYETTQVFPTNFDSTGRSAAPDTAEVWMMRNVHVAGAKPNIFVGAGPGVGDGGGGLLSTTADDDVASMMIGLAALDSASGGKVFDNKGKTPVKVGIVVDGVCSRSSRLNSGGIVPSDTSRFYATIDSMAALHLPVTFAVNIDSVGSYPRDVQYIKDNYREARFTPTTRAGLDTAIAFAPEGGTARKGRPVDTFRRFRNQSMAVGPAGTTSADTSLYALLTYAAGLGDSIWGADRSSRFAVAPYDDWSPYNLRGWQVDVARGVTLDSIFYAYWKAGFKGILINGSWKKGRPEGANSANPFGYVPVQGRYRVLGGSSINLLSHNGSSNFGQQMFEAVTDSTIPISVGSTIPTLGWFSSLRFWNGLFGYMPNSESQSAPGQTLDENGTGQVQRCRILKAYANELAGSGATTSYKLGDRVMWWAIRNVTQPIAVMNHAAGRSIIQIDYPENIVLP